MSKLLEDMTNEELWALFPIILSEYDSRWLLAYQEEADLLFYTVGNDIVRINHIGSTSVPGLIAKPTIDILLEVQANIETSVFIESIKNAGYIFTLQPGKPAPHMMFMKGYTPEGFEGQAVHLHVRYFGDWDELYFRDYLKEQPGCVQDYAKLKQELRKAFLHDRDGYTHAKTDFIKKATQTARKEFGERYKKF